MKIFKKPAKNTDESPNRFIKDPIWLTEAACLIILLVIMVVWTTQTYDQLGPDEGMRYPVAQWLYRHPGQLPRGDDPELIHGIWGISYAFYPILSYMISAVYMWAASIFTTAPHALFEAARLADVTFIMIAAIFIFKSGRKLFGGMKGFMFSVMIIFLPGFHFLGVYVNNDSLALMSVAIIFYAWVCALKEGWKWKNCIILAIGIGICFLSYYNAYGWILMSVVFFVTTMLLCTDRPWIERIKEMIIKGLGIMGISLGMSAWWFIRNMILYDGDFLGRNATNICAEKYAQDGFKPSQHSTPNTQLWSLKDMFIYQDPGWPHNWIVMVAVSFIGTFGFFNLYMKESVSKLYLAFLFLCLLGVIFMLRQFLWWNPYKRTTTRESTVAMINGRRVKTTQIIRVIEKSPVCSREGLFNMSMVGAMIIPFVLLVYYSYYSDLQCQGRYMISSIYSIMYFAAAGLGATLDRLVKNRKIHDYIYAAISVLWVAGAILNLIFIVIPGYK